MIRIPFPICPGSPLLSNVLPFQQDSDLRKLAMKISFAAGGVGEEVSQLGSWSTGCIGKVDS